MADTSETKMTRRDAILTTGKAAVTFGAAALFAGRLPKIQPLDTGDVEDDDIHNQEQPAGGTAKASILYAGNNTSPGDSTPTSHPVDVEFVPSEFVIAQDPSDSGYPASGLGNAISVLTSGRSASARIWIDSSGRQAFLLNNRSSQGLIVSGTSVNVGALEDAVRTLGLPGVTINQGPVGVTPAKKYRLVAFGSRSTASTQDDDNGVD
jgi:hypothetical protein